MMNIYEVRFDVYNYFYSSDRSGYNTVCIYFTTEEKADEWVKANQNRKFAYDRTNENGFKFYDENTADDEWIYEEVNAFNITKRNVIA